MRQGHAYQDTPGQPAAWQQAAFDIISTDVDSLASEAEAICITDEALRSMPGIETQSYEIFITHSACQCIDFFLLIYIDDD